MKWPCLWVTFFALAVAASAVEPTSKSCQPAPVALRITLDDGSVLARAMPVDRKLRVGAQVGGGLVVDWSEVAKLTCKVKGGMGNLLLRNGDRLTVHWIKPVLEVDHLLGRMEIPVGKVREIEPLDSSITNIALGKPVYGADGASHGKGLARHLTDGDPTTHAKPPASAFDYRIDLAGGTGKSYAIHGLAIHWGHFGDRFTGIRKQGSEDWAAAAWPGEYVTSYTVECRKAGRQEWLPIHRHQGRPVDEQADNVRVDKRPSQQPGCSSESTTFLGGLNVEGVVEVRIRAQGGHWIGLFELEVFGHPQGGAPSPLGDGASAKG